MFLFFFFHYRRYHRGRSFKFTPDSEGEINSHTHVLTHEIMATQLTPDARKFTQKTQPPAWDTSAADART